MAKSVAGVTTKYLIDDRNPTGYLQVMEEVKIGAVQVAYTYGTMVVNERQVAAGGQVSYYGYDAHGNVGFLTDATGSVTDSYDYDAWGNLVAHTGSTMNTHLFVGEEFDPDLGVLNLRARLYDPTRGRFLTPDPVDKAGHPSRTGSAYLYAAADPVNRLDPLGKEDEEEVHP